MKLKLLILYFILIQLFGISSSYLRLEQFDLKSLYMFLNFPLFGIIFNVNLWSLSSKLEESNPEEYNRIADENLLTKDKFVVSISSLFASKTIEIWKVHEQKIILTRWSLIFLIASFIFTILITMIP